MTIQLKRNDTKDTISYSMTYADGTPVNLTGATVRFLMGTGKSIVTDSAATIKSASSGQVEYTLKESDTLVAGTFKSEFQVTFSDGKVKTFPTNGYIMVNIQPNIDLDQSTYIEDQIANRVSDLQVWKNEIQAQLDEFAVGDSTPEVAQARVEKDGTTNTTLKARLDKKEAEFSSGIQNVNAQLAQTTTEGTGYGVVTGFLVRHQPIANANMSVQVDHGTAYLPSGKRIELPPTSSIAIDPADATQRRKDIIYLSSNGVVSYLKGGLSASGIIPETPSGGLLLAIVTIKAGVTAIYHSDVLDKRIFKYNNNQLTNKLQELKHSNALSIRPSEGTITKMFNYAETYVKNNSKFVYGGRDAFDEGDLYVSPEGKFEATCSTFCHLIAKGIPFENSRYNGLSRNIADKNFNDEIYVGDSFVTYEWAKWAYENGYAYVPNEDWSNVMPGDVLFFSWSNPNSELVNHNKAFMNIDHSATFVSKMDDGSINVYETTSVPSYSTYGNEQKKQAILACRLPFNDIDLEINNLILDGNKSYSVRGNYLVNEYKLSKPMKNHKWYTVTIKAKILTEGCFFSIYNGSQFLYSGNKTGISENGLYTFQFNTRTDDLSANTLRLLLVAESNEAVPESMRNADVEWIVLTEGFTNSITEFVDGGIEKKVTFTFETGYTGNYEVYYSDKFALLSVRLTGASSIADGALINIGTITGTTLKSARNLPCTVSQQLSASPSYATDMTAWIQTDTTPYRLRIKNGTTQNKNIVEISCMLPV